MITDTMGFFLPLPLLRAELPIIPFCINGLAIIKKIDGTYTYKWHIISFGENPRILADTIYLVSRQKYFLEPCLCAIV